MLELALLIFVYTVGHWLWRSETGLEITTWYASPEGKNLHLTLAGTWYSLVSLPICQFLLLRWYVRFAIWYRLLWSISKLKLQLLATHPDQAGDLAFFWGRAAMPSVPLFLLRVLQAPCAASVWELATEYVSEFEKSGLLRASIVNVSWVPGTFSR